MEIIIITMNSNHNSSPSSAATVVAITRTTITPLIMVPNSLVLLLVTSQVKPSVQLVPSQHKICLLRMLSSSQLFNLSTAVTTTTAIASSQELQSSRVIR